MAILRKLLHLLVALFLVQLTACRAAGPPSGNPQPDGVDIGASESGAENAAEAAGTGEPPPIEAGLAPPPGPYAPGFDALHYDIVLQLPDAGSFIRGIASAHVRLTSPRRDTLALDFTGLAVEAVGRDGEAMPFRHLDGRLLVQVPAGLSVSDTLRVDVTYSGHPDDGLILGRNIHGQPTAFADNWPNRARFWFPSIDHPSDKATVRFTVNAGADRQVVSNGSPGDDNAPAAWVWETHEPIPTYTMVIGAADFAVEEIGTVCIGSEPRRCTTVSTWLFPPDTAAAAASFRRSDEMVAFYNRLVAPFPYTKLAHVQSSTRFGGMENVSAIFYPEDALSAGLDIESTVAHETAHQWFGNAVTEADWNHLWLSEGFATYFGALFFEHADGPVRFREMMASAREDYLTSGAVDLPMVDPSQRNLFALLNANNYDKGAWVLHMLRRLMGDDDFFEGIRAYYREHEHGTALTEDLRRALEGASGRNLGRFFEQWVYSPGYPDLHVEWEWNGEAGVVNLRIDQTQPRAWPTFEVPVAVEFATPTGAVRHHLNLEGKRTEVALEVPVAPSAVVVDPEGDLLSTITIVKR